MPDDKKQQPSQPSSQDDNSETLPVENDPAQSAENDPAQSVEFTEVFKSISFDDMETYPVENDPAQTDEFNTFYHSMTSRPPITKKD